MAPPPHRKMVASVPLFADMTDGQQDEVLRPTKSRHYGAGTPVFQQGEPAGYFYVLLSGRLRVTQVDPNGQQTIVRMVNPGDLFGIARALQRSDYPGTATAVTDSVALQWPMAAWDELAERHPRFSINAMKTIGQRLQEAHTRVRELSTEEVERRVAHAVLRLASQGGRKEAGGIRIDFPISKQDIAEMTGTTLHTVSRILSAWERAGLVQGGRQKLLIREPHRLSLIGEGHQSGLI